MDPLPKNPKISDCSNVIKCSDVFENGTAEVRNIHKSFLIKWFCSRMQKSALVIALNISSKFYIIILILISNTAVKVTTKCTSICICYFQMHYAFESIHYLLLFRKWMLKIIVSSITHYIWCIFKFSEGFLIISSFNYSLK